MRRRAGGSGRKGGAVRRDTGPLSWIVFAALAAAPVACDSASTVEPEVWDSTWPRWTTAADVGFSADGLAEVEAYAETLGTTGLFVLVGGQVLHTQGDVRETSYVASVRKSILSVLYGRHVVAGTIDLDRTIGSLGLDDEEGLLAIEREATIRDLITARSGVYHPASNGGDDAQAAPPRGSMEPGSYFLYNNWDFNAAGAVFEQATGLDIYDALRDDLAIPLGMEDFDRASQRRSGDLTVSRFPAYHIWLSTRDLARIGELLLRNGRWNGRQVVPEEWIAESTGVITPVEEMNPASRRDGVVGFGMMWWVWDGPAATGAFAGAYTAAGAYGQYLTVLPVLDMVVAHKTAVGDGRGFGRQTRFAEYRGILTRLAEARSAAVGSAAQRREAPAGR